MAVKTKFLKEDFCEILKKYALGEYVDSTPFSTGAVQTNIMLQTTEGKYVFKYYENRNQADVIFEGNLIRYLNNRKYPCPAPFKDRRGKIVGIYQDKPFIISEFIEGEHLDNPDDNQLQQLIQKVAELHVVTKNYAPANKKYRWNYCVDFCNELAIVEEKKLSTANSKHKLAWFQNELKRIKLPKSLPKGICHCDFHFTNVIFRNGRFKALIDFDDANYTYLIYDLAALIDPFKSEFAWDTWYKFDQAEDAFDFSESNRTVSEYIRHRKLNDIEKSYFFDVYKLTVMIDCLWRFERGNADDFYEKRKIDYLDALGSKEFYNRLFRE